MSDKPKTNSKPVSFEDIQKKFINFSEPQSISDNTSDIKFFSNPEQLDASHFKFDANSPNAVLIAGCACDSGAGDAGDAGADSGASAAADTGCLDSSSTSCKGPTSCDASCSL